ncbi:ATP-binding cassette domain-containing protein [Nocardioides carbamazepini]|uniref:ATP-binding cassette domain-containing protein n=1 Tax=Nocardioides carbamazepini TaxID=2854259 RepID=UPI00214A49B1|nr:ATP-binding cassette domain-containing protein [Nocardioides carbamazepini]MCR1785256.1 ATP-binding cassette domain-containing protein [Nocardioides carbamazepini]
MTVREEPAPSPRTTPAPVSHALELRGIGKRFGVVTALADVDLTVACGEVHALVGENGAGKSTLMAIASGALAADQGRIVILGEELADASPDRARELGLAIVRQHPALLPDLTVAENMVLGVGFAASGVRGAVSWSREQLAPWGMEIDPRARVRDLPIEQWFVIEIAKALALRPKVLVLDEPTEHLSLDEVRLLFRRLREIVADGTAVVYISHRIPEVKEIADRITVLRDGRTRGVYDAATVSEDQVVELVVGRALETVFPPKGSVVGTVGSREQLVVEGLSGERFHDVSFSVRAGEVVGLAGVQGNGQAELLRAIAGLEPSRGTVFVDGRPVSRGSTAVARRAGVVHVPADRHEEGLFLPLSVADNVVAATLGRVSTAGLVRDRAVDARAEEQRAALGIKTPSVGTPVASLSGGNQQKVVMARTVLADPDVLLAEEPTQGVDAGARVDIYGILRSIADTGAAVVVLSSDGVELEGLCDRVLIVSRGHVVKELTGAEVTEEAIAHAALTATTVRARAESAPDRRSGWRRLAGGDHAPAAVLVGVMALLGLVVGAQNASYFSSFNVYNLLFMAAPLVLVGAAQHLVVLTGGIDLSVGPQMGLLVVVGSFWVVDGGNPAVGLLLMALTGLGIGLVNGVLVAVLGIDAVVATLAVFMALQGLYLTLREVPGGIVAEGLSTQVMARIGPLPVAILGAAVAALALEVALRRTRWGLALRATGSRREAAENIGVRTVRVQLGAYVLAGALTFAASVLLMAQIGIGDGRPGVGYTLSSITVVVLAGASVFGGRGSFVGVLAAGLLVQQLLSASPFLQLPQAWSYLLPGLVILAAAVLFGRLQHARKA